MLDGAPQIRIAAVRAAGGRRERGAGPGGRGLPQRHPAPDPRDPGQGGGGASGRSRTACASSAASPCWRGSRSWPARCRRGPRAGGGEVALLKTLGMTRGGVVAVYAAEYALVGLVAGAIGSAGAAGCSPGRCSPRHGARPGPSTRCRWRWGSWAAPCSPWWPASPPASGAPEPADRRAAARRCEWAGPTPRSMAATAPRRAPTPTATGGRVVQLHPVDPGRHPHAEEAAVDGDRLGRLAVDRRAPPRTRLTLEATTTAVAPRHQLEAVRPHARGARPGPPADRRGPEDSARAASGSSTTASRREVPVVQRDRRRLLRAGHRRARARGRRRAPSVLAAGARRGRRLVHAPAPTAPATAAGVG